MERLDGRNDALSTSASSGWRQKRFAAPGARREVSQDDADQKEGLTTSHSNRNSRFGTALRSTLEKVRLKVKTFPA